jgi:aspartyl/asparaginyl beta-hydroxylase (cupin superfamily)
MNKLFYTVDEVCTDLHKMDAVKEEVLKEVHAVNSNNWHNWPEKGLYGAKGDWKIFPFYAFGGWSKTQCDRCPTIHNFLKQVKGLKLATLSKLTPGMKLHSHRGWGNHSNNVIRCHYGLIVPEGAAFISVSENQHFGYQDKHHKQFEWLVFDDSKWHYATNTSPDSERIVLILDVDRPSNIERGTSDVGDTKELLEIVNYFKRENDKFTPPLI